ncbi:hypothetical protein KAI87_14280, partial [Myxococcota bacterium]|nr:hypothetical protein [Myxococcota bacterium]
CDTSCDDGDTWTENDSCVADDVCVGTAIEQVGYCLYEKHASSSVASTSNLIQLMAVHKTLAGAWRVRYLEDLGTFANQPSYWVTVYNYTNIPENCYDIYAAHNGTFFEGLSQVYFPGQTKAELVQILRDSISDPYTWHWAANASAANLCLSGNFWTELLFKDAGADFIETRLTNY